MRLLFVLFFISTYLSYSTSYADEPVRASIELAEGVRYSNFKCSVNGNEVDLHEIHFRPTSNLQMRVIRNPEAIVDHNCRGGYGGADLSQLIKKHDFTKESFRPLALINGNFFRTQRKSKRQIGYVPIGLLWSKLNSSQGKLFEKLRLKGGKDLLLVDDKGAHKLSLNLENCGNETCVSFGNLNDLSSKNLKKFSKRMRSQEFLRALQSLFPKMTFASQLSMDLTGGTLDKAGNLVHYSKCDAAGLEKDKKEDDELRSSWKCRQLPRTIFCGKRDGTISLFTTLSAYVYDIASGLTINGVCSSECDVLFNLDGGGSTQIGFLDPRTKKFQISGAPHGGPSTCGSLRPVDHYFALGFSP